MTPDSHKIYECFGSKDDGNEDFILNYFDAFMNASCQH